MLQPSRTKYRQQQQGRNYGIATRGAKVSFGEFGLKALERGRLTARQIEAARRAMTRHIKRGGRVFIRIFPDKPISRKPAEVRIPLGRSIKADMTMKATELRTKADAELKKELEDLLRAQFSLRMQKATQQLNNTSQMRKVRRDIARVRTVLAQKAADK